MVLSPKTLPVRADEGRARKDEDLIWFRQKAESIGLFARGRLWVRFDPFWFKFKLKFELFPLWYF